MRHPASREGQGTCCRPNLWYNGPVPRVAVARGNRRPYQEHAAWNEVRMLKLDRAAEEKKGTFGSRIAAEGPDAVIDMICFSPESQRMLIDALRGRVGHLLVCGTIWVHGHSARVPVREEDALRPLEDYGIKKREMERMLHAETRRGGIPGTTIHPGHIVGPGWVPLNPEGHFDTDVYRRMSRGEEISIPNFGMETVHHVHAEDVARLFVAALENWSTAVGESFHAVSDGALSLRGYAEAMFHWFGHEPNVRYAPWDEWKRTHTDAQAGATWSHIIHSPSCSMEKAQRRLGYLPRWSSLSAVQEAVTWLTDHDYQTH